MQYQNLKDYHKKSGGKFKKNVKIAVDQVLSKEINILYKNSK